MSVPIMSLPQARVEWRPRLRPQCPLLTFLMASNPDTTAACSAQTPAGPRAAAPSSPCACLGHSLPARPSGLGLQCRCHRPAGASQEWTCSRPGMESAPQRVLPRRVLPWRVLPWRVLPWRVLHGECSPGECSCGLSGQADTATSCVPTWSSRACLRPLLLF